MMLHVKHDSHSDDDLRGSLTPSDVLGCLWAVGVDADEGQAELLRAHALAVIRTNKHLNLTSVTSREQVLNLHIADSATALRFVQASPPGSVADIGSGAGYPGIVLAVLSCRDFVLVESVAKKANFLREVAESLGLEIGVQALRAEELAATCPAAFTCVVARAVSSLPALIELASPLLNLGGHLVCMKGRLTAEESDAGDAAASRCGMRLLDSSAFELPNGEARAIVVYERRGHVRERLPRRAGMAQRHPLS